MVPTPKPARPNSVISRALKIICRSLNRKRAKIVKEIANKGTVRPIAKALIIAIMMRLLTSFNIGV